MSADVFLERFPRYVFSLPFWQETPFQGGADSSWIAKLPLRDAEVLYIYGLDPKVALLLQDWLRENPRRRLLFLEPEGGRIVYFLSLPEAKDLLALTQIEIYHLPKGRDGTFLIQELADRYPLKGIYAVQSPVSLCKKAFARVHQRILHFSACAHAQFVERIQISTLLSHFLKNVRRLPSSFYANHFKDVFQGIPALLCGAGPSLQYSFATLRKVEGRALIFAGGSALAALQAQGITPHFAMALDPNPEEGERFKHLPKQEIPLLYSTRLFPSCIPVFQGSCGYLRSGMSGCLEQWIDKELGLTDSPLGVDLPSTAFSVTLLAAAFAVHCGCDPILFDGVDLAYTNQKRYADGVGSGEEILSLATSPVDRPVKVRNRAGALVTSAVRWTIEASVLSRFAKKNKTRHFIACTKEGLEIKGMQAMPLDIALQSFCTQEYDLRAKVTKACNDHPMPAMCSERINAALAGLHHSLQAVVFHFKLLAENETSGQSALAELELQEELAYQVLFSDSAWALRALEPGGQSCWKTLYEMAKQCLHLFDQNSSI